MLIFNLFVASIFLDHVYCTETRPYNQGARLTAYELVHDKIPATLIVDSMVSALMKQRNITAVVVGADRVSIISARTFFNCFCHFIVYKMLHCFIYTYEKKFVNCMGINQFR